MRLFHYKMLEYLPSAQLRGQWRECGLIAQGIQENGTPNHLLVNKVMEYPIDEFLSYCCRIYAEMKRRDFRILEASHERFAKFGAYRWVENPFEGWHTKEYLRSNMANLWEKHFMGVGKSRIKYEEWQRLCEGYKNITGEEYKI